VEIPAFVINAHIAFRQFIIKVSFRMSKTKSLSLSSSHSLVCNLLNHVSALVFRVAYIKEVIHVFNDMRMSTSEGGAIHLMSSHLHN